jgi:hypothetical protein
LEGSLDAFSLPDIFSLLSMTKKNGALRLRRPGVAGVAYFTAGSLTGAVSDTGRHGLGHRLAAAGRVTEDALAAAVDAAAADTSTGLARELLQAGAIDDSTLHEVVSEQITDAIFDLMRWPDGEFAFIVDEPNPDDVGVSRGVDEVVAEARNRLEAWSRVAASIPGPATVLSLSAAVDGDAVLSPDEWPLVAFVDGRRTVGEICQIAGRGEFTVVTALAALVDRRLLQADATDAVTALMRRQQLLTRLEGDVSAPAPAAEPPAPAVEAAAPEPRVPTAVEETVAEPAVVTPARPEPFLPSRRPEHPEEMTSTVAAVIDGTAAIATNPASLIERDPSVNKSLLLRLIAGVRGL